MEIRQLSPTELERMRDAGEPFALLDVREAEEREISVLGFDVHIPLASLPARISELDRTAPIVVYCRTGGRSQSAAAFLVAQGFVNVSNLAGGINRWAQEVDPSLPVY